MSVTGPQNLAGTVVQCWIICEEPDILCKSTSTSEPWNALTYIMPY